MQNEQLDVAVIGAGFSGMYLLHRLRDELGLKVQLFEHAHGSLEDVELERAHTICYVRMHTLSSV